RDLAPFEVRARSTDRPKGRLAQSSTRLRRAFSFLARSVSEGARNKTLADASGCEECLVHLLRSLLPGVSGCRGERQYEHERLSPRVTDDSTLDPRIALGFAGPFGQLCAHPAQL